MEEKYYRMTLNRVLGLGKTLFRRLHRRIGSIQNIFMASSNDFMSVGGGEKTAKEILRFNFED